jgi:hypothetical protein
MARHLFAHAPFTALSFPVMSTRKIQKCVFTDVGNEDDATAVPTVPAIGPPLRDEFLAAKGNAAVPPVTSFDVDDGFVDEHRRRKSETRNQKSESNPNDQAQNGRATFALGHRGFGLNSDFGFLVSGFLKTEPAEKSERF